MCTLVTNESAMITTTFPMLLSKETLICHSISNFPVSASNFEDLLL